MTENAGAIGATELTEKQRAITTLTEMLRFAEQNVRNQRPGGPDYTPDVEALKLGLAALRFTGAAPEPRRHAPDCECFPCTGVRVTAESLSEEVREAWRAVKALLAGLPPVEMASPADAARMMSAANAVCVLDAALLRATPQTVERRYQEESE